MEQELALETTKVINKLLTTPLGEQVYRDELAVLFNTLKWLNTPILKVP